jgi:hypothetical protein
MSFTVLLKTKKYAKYSFHKGAKILKAACNYYKQLFYVWRELFINSPKLFQRTTYLNVQAKIRLFLFPCSIKIVLGALIPTFFRVL